MRRTLLSVAVGLAGAAGVTASGWALQAAALPPPTPAAQVAADASAWFHEYRLLVDVFHFHHRRTKGACLRGWFPGALGSKDRASLLSLESGSVFRESKRHPVRLVRGHPGRRLPGALAIAAGCSGALAPTLATAAQSGTHLRVERSYAANRPAIALEVSRSNDERLTLYVSPETYRPLVAIVALDGREATARLYLSRLNPDVLTRFRLLRQVAPEPRR